MLIQVAFRREFVWTSRFLLISVVCSLLQNLMAPIPHRKEVEIFQQEERVVCILRHQGWFLQARSQARGGVRPSWPSYRTPSKTNILCYQSLRGDASVHVCPPSIVHNLRLKLACELGSSSCGYQRSRTQWGGGAGPGLRPSSSANSLHSWNVQFPPDFCLVPAFLDLLFVAS